MAYVKANNANITQVSYDWDSIKTVVGGNGTPQGGGMKYYQFMVMPMEVI